METLVIIDGKSVFYRGYYAMGALSKSDGTPTGGIYGFAVIAMELVKKLQPAKVVVAWDKAKTSVSQRTALYKDYKAGRKKQGEDFYAQIPLLKDLIGALGWSFVECDNYEADDIIGTLARQATKENYETVIISSDLDMLQIVGENVKMYRLLKGFSELEEIDIKALEEKYGIKQAQFLDLKALKGDNSDNIPGVPGIGEKGAVKLLNDYGTLDGIYAHLDEITGATKTKLEAGKDSAYLSKKLAEIMFDAPVSLASLPDLKTDPEKILPALKSLEFNSLIRKFSKELFSVGGQNPKWSPDNEEISVSGPAPQLLEWDIKQKMHENPTFAKKILGGETPFWDLNQAKFLLNPLERKTDDLDKQKQLAFDFGETPEERAEKLAEYAREQEEFKSLPKLLSLYQNFDLPLIPVLYKMETLGIKISKPHFNNLKSEYEKIVFALEQKVYDATTVPYLESSDPLPKTEFNLNSPIQLASVLFDRLKLPTKGIKKTTRGHSTGVKELEKLKNLHPIVPLIMEYREASKLLNTYIIPLPGLADENNRIHTTYTQNITATGRLSSVSPNLQNIPVRSEAGKRIREGFVAEKGKKFIQADYSQFELRLAAVLAGDENLIADFNSGVDIHTKTASDVFNLPLDQVTKDQRRAAKTINFGVLYGMSPKSLAEQTSMNFSEAQQFINDYFTVRRPIRDFLDRILRQAREEGYVETYFGRRRPTPDVKSPSFVVRQAAERAAANMPVQGTEADLMKLAMIKLDQLLPDGSALVLQIHDSLVVECDEDKVDEVSNLLKTTMESIAPDLKVRLDVEIKVGDNLGEV